MNMLRCALIVGTAIAVSAATAADIIIESRDGGSHHDWYKEQSGRWLDSNTPANTSKSAAPDLTPQEKLGARKTTLPPKPTGEKDTVLAAARFQPVIETAGDYHVYVTFPKAANATPLTYVIKHAKGEESKDIAQNGWGRTGTGNGDAWVDLGTFNFAAGADQYVEMRVTGATGAVDPENPLQAFADAARFSTDAVPSAVPAGPAMPGLAHAPKPKPGAAPAAAASGASASASAGSSGPIEWVPTLAAGRTAAQEGGKKLLVFFYSPQSTRSTEYEEKVLNSPAAKSLIKQNFVAVKVNMDAERELTSQLQVFRAGTVNVYDGSTGAGLEHISDTPEADELVKRLTAVK